jgi:predicted lipoprotein with Yx(FWY)xxD motif
MQLRNTIYTLFILLIPVLLTSCSKSGSSSYGTTPPPYGGGTGTISVQVKTDPHFGTILTDADGKTLYFFSPDANGSSSCTGNCLVYWPVFYTANATYDVSLTKTDFSTITRSDGSKQTTYKGWPLYYYAGDSKGGDLTGDGVDGIWFVAKPDYQVMIAVNQLVGEDGKQYDSTYAAGTGNTVYITDDRGATLYAYTLDKFGKNNYTAADFSNDSYWPIVQVTTIGALPSSLDKSWFSTTSVFGKTQLTFKGWPVYHFALDGGIRGYTKGVSITSPGTWPVMDQYSPAAP